MTCATRLSIRTLSAALNEFSSLCKDPSLKALQIFLIVAEFQALSASEIGAMIGLSQSAVSRNVIALGKGRPRERGLGLLSQRINPANTRSHVIQLTKKGRVLADRLHACVNEPQVTGVSSAVELPSLRPTGTQNLHWEIWA